MSAEPAVLREGGEERPAATAPTAPPGPPGGRKPRLKPVDRQQVCLRVIDPERLIEPDHPARAIWDLLGRLQLEAYYAGIEAVEGRPGRDCSDPRVLIALWLYALSRGVREARALDEWAQYEPGCQWLLGLGRINYHTLADFVTEHAAALDELFLQRLQVLMSEGLADLERVAHDGTKIRAAASRRSFKREQRLAECRRLAEEHLAALQQQPAGELRAACRKAQERAARERLQRLRQAEEALKRQQAEKAPAEQAPVQASVTDPDAGIMRQGDGGFAPSYNAQITTDARHGVILAYEASQAKEDSQELQPALERVEKNLGRAPNQALVDGSYTTRQNIMDTAAGPTELIGALGEDRSRNKLARHGVSPEFFPEHFVFDAAANGFTCPVGKLLPYQGGKKLVGATEKHYRAKASDCQSCPFRSQCCPKTAKQGRLLIRTEEDPKVAAFRQKMQRPEYRAIYRQRARVAEFSNACLKEKKGLRQFLRRGLAKVRTELAWACLSCNVAIWIRRVWKVTQLAPA
jgi:transposase